MLCEQVITCCMAVKQRLSQSSLLTIKTMLLPLDAGWLEENWRSDVSYCKLSETEAVTTS